MTRFEPAVDGSIPSGADAVTLLTVLLVIRLGLPSQFVLGPLGAAGSPAGLLGIASLALWAWFRLHRTISFPTAPVNAGVVALTAAVSLSFIVVSSRPTTSGEFSAATLAVVLFAGWVGGLLIASDGITSMGRLVTLIRRLVLLGGAFAGFGLVQFVTSRAWVDQLSIPGLSVNNTVYSLTAREGFNRPMGTAIHPIEFGSIICMLWPLAVVYGLGVHGRRRGRRALLVWVPAVVGCVAVALSSSRSAMLGLVVGMAALMPILTRAQRWLAGVAFALLAVFVFLFVPGMVGAISGLFTGVGTDSSVASRVESYAIAAEYIARSPLLGRGMGTFLPRYRIFDNQYLLSLVDMGFVGVIALIALIAAATLPLLRLLRTEPTGSRVRLLAGGLLSSCLVGAVSLAFFDGFSFPMMPGVWFILMGLSGALYRLAGRPARATVQAPPDGTAS